MYELSKGAANLLNLLTKRRAWTFDELKNSLKVHNENDLKYWIAKYKKKGLVIKIPNLKDMRRTFYRIATKDEFIDSSQHLKRREVRYYEQILSTLLGQ